MSNNLTLQPNHLSIPYYFWGPQQAFGFGLGSFKLIKILFGSVQISRIYLRFYCLLFRKSDC